MSYKKLEMKNTPIRIQQAEGTFEVFRDFFHKENLDYVIEIGTGMGWLSYFLYQESLKHGFKFTTYDIDENRIKDLQKYCNGEISFDYRVRDCFDDIEFIKNTLNDNRCLIMCDGGNKVKEVNVFASLIKNNSFLMAHDYAPTREYFDKFTKGKIWGAFEIKDKDISNELDENNVVKSDYYEEFLSVAWLSCIKPLNNQRVIKYEYYNDCNGSYT